MNRTDWLGVKDKWDGYSWYHRSINLLTIQYTQTKTSGTMTGWILRGPFQSSGTTPTELISVFESIINNVDASYNTDKKIYNHIIVYIDRLDKIIAWFNDYITDYWSNKTIVLLDHIEFRSYLDLNNALNDDTAMEYLDFCYNNYFVKDHKWYLTMQQRIRYILKHCPKSKAIPYSSAQISLIRYGFYGGLCYCPIPKGYFEDCLYADLDSAYIWALLTKQYPSSEPKHVTNIDTTKSHYGVYQLTYTCKSSIINRYKQITDDRKLVPLIGGEHITVMIALNDIDIDNLRRIANIESIRPLNVWEFEVDYISTELRTALLHLYTEKCRLKPINQQYKASNGCDMPEYKAIKAQLNGVFGNLFPHTWDNLVTDSGKPIHGKALADYLYISPYWAGYVTAYVFRLLLSAGLNVDNWHYSDTDSIICDDTDNSREIFSTINSMIRQSNLDLDLPEHLGQFDIEHVNRLKTYTHKQYLYETNDGIFVKAAGCSVERGKDYFNYDRIPKGRQVKRHVDNGYYETVTNIDNIADIINTLVS